MKIAKMKEFSLSKTVAMHNTIVRGGFNMGEIETLIFYRGLERINKKDTDFSINEIHASEILKDNAGGKSYELIKQAIGKLVTRVITIEQNAHIKGERIATFIQIIDKGAKYDEKTGIITFKFNEMIKPFLLNLSNGNFTAPELRILLSFKKTTAQRLYWILKSHFYGDTTELEINLEDLKLKLEVKNIHRDIKDKYKNFFDFEKGILKPAVEEINKTHNTDLKISYQPIKVGRGIGKIIFKKEFNPLEIPGPVLPGILLTPEIEAKLKAAGVTSIEEIARLVFDNTITEGYILYCLTCRRQKTKSTAGAIYKDIVEGYRLAAYQQEINKPKQTPIFEAETTPGTYQMIIELSEAEQAFKQMKVRGNCKFASFVEYLDGIYLSKGFKIIQAKNTQFIVK